ncbi:MAG: hypothetical protein ACE5RF_00450 [Nitrosarchaeum sp.]
MNIDTKDLLDKILDAPVGQVVTVLEENLKCNVKLEVIEQNTITPNQFVRNVLITAQGLPVVKANVKFDSTVLPEFIMAEILKRRQGIGTILNGNHIRATRNIISLNRVPEENKVSREYEIIYNGVIWFTISEEIRLDSFSSNNNS